MASRVNYKTFHRPLRGRNIDLIPLSAKHTPDIVRLRNSPGVKKIFDDKNPITEKSQSAFLEKYVERQDDLYWCITLKNQKVIGTDRLNEIDGKTGYKGSLIVDNDFAYGPFALESGILLLSFAFDILNLETVCCLIRPDNVKVVSFNSRLGFKMKGPYELRGVIHDEYSLDRAAFVPDQFDTVINYFAQRGSQAAS